MEVKAGYSFKVSPARAGLSFSREKFLSNSMAPKT